MSEEMQTNQHTTTNKQKKKYLKINLSDEMEQSQ